MWERESATILREICIHAEDSLKLHTLQAIRESLNKFDVKTTKTKHTVLGAKPAKGSTGRPGLSKQAGIENVDI